MVQGHSQKSGGVDRPGEKHTEPGSVGCMLSFLHPPGWYLQVVVSSGYALEPQDGAGGCVVVQGECAAGS